MTWQLQLNTSKTRIIIMKKGGPPSKIKFHFNEDEIPCTNTYKYLGTIINSNGTFTSAREELKK